MDDDEENVKIKTADGQTHNNTNNNNTTTNQNY
jgi:hypothetical protein